MTPEQYVIGVLISGIVWVICYLIGRNIDE